MSNKVSFLYIAKNKFSAVANQVARSSDKVRRKFRGLSDQLKKTGKRFRQTVRGFSVGLKGLVAAALSFVGIRKAISIGAEFQDSIADLSAITGAAGKDLDNLTAKTLKMAKASVTSQAEVATAIKLVASAKPDLLENLDALTATTKQVLLLKNAAGIDLASAANITAQGLNIFGAEASKAGEFVNVLAAGAKLGSSEIAETGQAMLLAGPAAKAAGLSFVQLNAAIQTTAKGGIKGARAGTALNAIFGRLRRQGFDFKKLGLQGVFEKVGKQLAKIKNPTKRAQEESKIFGEEHSKVGLAILENTNLLGQYSRTLKGTNIANEQAAIRLNTFSKRWDAFIILIKDVAIRTFLKLEPLLTKQIASLTKWFDAIDEEQINGFAESLKGLVTVASVVFDIFKGIAFVFKEVGVAIGELVAKFSLLKLDSDLLTDIGKAVIDFSTLGLIDFDKKIENNLQPQRTLEGISSQTQQSRTDINVNLRAPEGAVESVKAATSGKVSGLNVGMNMVTE